MIYVICGKKRSGKDTVACLMSDVLSAKSGVDVGQFAFARKIKSILTHSGSIFYKTNSELCCLLGNIKYWYEGDRDQILPMSDEEAILFLKESVKTLLTHYISKDHADMCDDFFIEEIDVERGKPWTARRLMQVFGTDIVCDNINKNIWVNLTISEIIECVDDWNMQDAIITDCRQDHEEKALRLFGAKFIHVNRNTDSDDKHITEKGLTPRPGDIVIDNNGTLIELKSNIEREFK